ncbi:MAG TPA: hypothetical protein VFK89_03620 [Actinomycetota bacterium]|nr:hypothetical protein [Actinomycetota bacterium]
MAIREKTDALTPIAAEVARHVGRYGLKKGAAAGAPAALRVTVARDVSRTVQVYWTPFVAEVPGRSISLHLEVAEPTVHWGEAYLSTTDRNWVFVFAERPDGEIQLARYGDYPTPEQAIDEFFKFVGWYVLEATGRSWNDVVFEVGDEVPWGSTQEAQAEVMATAVQESLKKSTIMWLRFSNDGRQQTLPVWYFYDQKVGKVYVLSGERQQTIPGAENLREVDVILRWKGRNSSVAEIPAGVRVIRGDDPEWTELADRIAEKRLNIPGMPEDTARRWRDECVILELSLRS